MEYSNNLYRSKKDIEKIGLDIKLPKWVYLLRDIYFSKDDEKDYKDRKSDGFIN